MHVSVDCRVVDVANFVVAPCKLLGIRQVVHIDALAAQFGHSLGQNLLVGFESDVGDVAALLGAEQVTRTANIEVLHRDVESRAQIRELLDGAQSASRIVGQQLVGRREQVAVGLLVGAPHATAHLV